MKTLILLATILSAFYSNFASAQVQLNINLHPVSEIEMPQNIECLKKQRDLIVSFEIKTFMARTDSFLRVEMTHLTPQKQYLLSYNDIQESLTSKKPYRLTVIKHGPQIHRLGLTIKNAPLSLCREIEDSLLISVEPM